MKRNRQRFYYRLYLGKGNVVNSDGNRTGEKRAVYGDAVQYFANISPATGYALTEQFGNLDNYDKVIVTADMNCPIDEQSILYVDKEPETNLSGDPMPDYIVRRVSKSLNSISIAIRKVSVS